mgnify:CR=1 FL=1
MPPARTAVLFINHATRDGNETYDPKVTDSQIIDGPIEQEGIKAGEVAAQAMLDARKDDGYMAAFTPTIGTNLGNWRPIGWPP